MFSFFIQDYLIFSTERTSTSVRMEALGAAMAAGQAEGIEVWDINKEPETAVTHDAFIPTTNNEGKWFSVLSSRNLYRFSLDQVVRDYCVSHVLHLYWQGRIEAPM